MTSLSSGFRCAECDKEFLIGSILYSEGSKLYCIEHRQLMEKRPRRRSSEVRVYINNKLDRIEPTCPKCQAVLTDDPCLICYKYSKGAVR